jgi:hypothetical protein
MPPIGFYQSSELGAHHGRPQTPTQTRARAVVRRSMRDRSAGSHPSRGEAPLWAPHPRLDDRSSWRIYPRWVVVRTPHVARPCPEPLEGTTRAAVRKPPRENGLASARHVVSSCEGTPTSASSRNEAREASPRVPWATENPSGIRRDMAPFRPSRRVALDQSDRRVGSAFAVEDFRARGTEAAALLDGLCVRSSAASMCRGACERVYASAGVLCANKKSRNPRFSLPHPCPQIAHNPCDSR